MTVNLPDEVARRLAAEAARRGVTPEQMAVEAIEAQLPPEAAERPVRRRLSFIGMGASGGGENVAERHDEIIREHFADKTAGDV